MDMKRGILIFIMLFGILAFTSCSKEEIFITTEDVAFNTMLVKRDGSIYVAIVEDFDKSHYNLSELNEFVSKEVKAYNDEVGSDEVSLESLEIKNDKAVMIIRYSKMAHYSAFNNIQVAYFSADTDNVDLDLPAQYINAKKETLVSKEDAFKSKKDQVLVVYEPFDIILEGKVRFYSENATYIEENKIHSASEDMTVVIYKPM
jgi:hypothetical protein